MRQKTVYITEDLHTELKIYCATNKLKLNSHIEYILRKHGLSRRTQNIPKYAE